MVRPVTNTPFPGASPADPPPASARPFAPSTPARKGLTPGRFLLALALVILIACGGTTTASKGGDTDPATGAADEPADAGPGATKDAPAPVGTDVTPAKGWTIKVTAPATDATDAIVKANQFNKPQIPGVRLISVPVSITNGSDRPGAAFTQIKVGALPPSGVKVEQKFAVAGYPTLDILSQLQPGATLAGNMVFELDPATLATTVLLAEPQITLDVNDDQRFLALK